MQITVAESAGYCFGVKRAVEMAERLAERGPVETLGPLIHNRLALEALHARGVREIASPEEASPGATVLIRAHGVPESVTRQLDERGIRWEDATCPFVAKIHRIAARESALGRTVCVIGDRSHPEVRGICGHAAESEVFADETELTQWLREGQNAQKSLSFVAQTTSKQKNWEQCVKSLKKQCTNAKSFDTICCATGMRQREAENLAAVSDVMLVLGDKASSNTAKLVEIAREHCPRVYALESAEELKHTMWENCERVGITAGASTPAWILKEVVNKMTEELKTAQNEAEESFETMLEASIKTLSSGDRVTGIVTGITSGEVNVDLGVKQAAYIPVGELSDDPNYKVEENIHIGDEIEAFVIRVSDIDGVCMLSKKKMDSIRGWDVVEEAKENHTVMEGLVTEENKGGIVVMVNGVRVFVPASQSGLPKDTPMTGLLNQKVRLKITEVTRARRRVVGSIRAVQQEERRAKAEALWAEIEEGKEYTGVVKSLTSYGAFVDIGGVDGMVHISELSWGRVRHPSEVVSVGDIVNVYVIGVDKEKKKISLGYRRPEDNPWTKFISNYSIGDTAKVKIAKFMPFGAFAEVLPGVDGLIHISQIADHRIGKAEDVLELGQEVDARIIDIDMDRQKISLSIRALLEEAAEEESDEAPAEEPAEEPAAEEPAEEPAAEEPAEAPAEEPAAEAEQPQA